MFKAKEKTSIVKLGYIPCVEMMLTTGLAIGDPVTTCCVPAGSADTDNGLPGKTLHLYMYVWYTIKCKLIYE